MQRAKIFRAVEAIENSYNEARYGKQPHRLTDDEQDDWAAAADMGFKPDIKNAEQARKLIRAINPVRFRQCQSDFKWLQKQMKKIGLNPEDARYLL